MEGKLSIYIKWLENQNFGKQITLRLEFCIDDEIASRAKFQDNRRIFRGSAGDLKFKFMKKVNFLRFFLIFDFFNFSTFQIFSLKFVPVHNVMINVVSEFQRIPMMYRGSATPNRDVFPFIVF